MPVNKLQVAGRFLEVPEGIDHKYSPSRTPPSCRPSFLANSAQKAITPSKLVEPARQKLVFDDQEDDLLDKEIKRHEPSPIKMTHDTSGHLKVAKSRDSSFRSPMPIHRMTTRSRTPSPAVITFNGGRDFKRRELYQAENQSRNRRLSRGRRANNMDAFVTHRASPLLN